MITDPWFYALAIPAICLTGLAKGGFLAGIGGLSVPLMSLAISPVQAAAIMLPILIAMDWIGVWAYWRQWSAANLRIMLPAAVLGVGIGWATAAFVSESHVRLLVGLIGLVFTLDHWLQLRPKAAAPGPSWAKGSFWAVLVGFTSFVSHSGGPPYAVYMLPQRLRNSIYAGTSIMLFSTVNLIKVPPYLMLGQFTPETLKTTAALVPLAPIAMLVGILLTRRARQEPFYRIAYACLFLVSLKLIADGLGLG